VRQDDRIFYLVPDTLEAQVRAALKAEKKQEKKSK